MAIVIETDCHPSFYKSLLFFKLFWDQYIKTGSSSFGELSRRTWSSKRPSLWGCTGDKYHTMGLKFVLHHCVLTEIWSGSSPGRIASTETGLKCHLKSAESWSRNEAASVQLLKNDFILAKWHCAFREGFVECKCMFIGNTLCVILRLWIKV